ncbi:MAG: alpha/beta fold hydrolase [Candidatus Lokiarchaeota archaeon]
MKYIFIHGLESSGKGFKGKFFKRTIPGILTPTFEPFDPFISNKMLLDKRMKQLIEVLSPKEPWILIGSSFGGLMASLYALENPKKVEKMVLLAPLLATMDLEPSNYEYFTKPVVIFHGKNDNVIPIGPTRKRAEKVFQDLSYIIVDDDHMLHKTVESLNWLELLRIN